VAETLIDLQLGTQDWVFNHEKVFTNFLQDDWADWLTLTEFNHNNQVSKTMGFSLFFITMGFHLQKGTELCLEVLTEDATQSATWMSKF
jgi:hypothetical protein